MTTTLFWQIIDKSRKKDQSDLDVLYDELLGQLCRLEIPELMQWQRILDQYLRIASEHESGITHCAGWLVSRGREVFFAALRDPESLAGLQIEGKDELLFEEILYAAKSAYFQKQGVVVWDLAMYRKELGRYNLDKMMEKRIASEIITDKDINYLCDVG